jgi:hypothetical protein
MAQAGRFNEIAAYCLGDVIASFRLMLRLRWNSTRGSSPHAKPASGRR